VGVERARGKRREEVEEGSGDGDCGRRRHKVKREASLENPAAGDFQARAG
jgi:hypothetical protein